MTKQENKSICPLCEQPPDAFCSDRARDYLQCPQCGLVFVPDEHLLSPAEEKERYDHHQNNPADSGYRNFLNRLFQPLEKKLFPGACGLDFGCGPGPTLSLMFEEAGYECSIYDLYYANDSSVFDRRYDFLTCSETMEHMYRPGEEFERFVKLVKPGGWIGIMTQLHDEAPVSFERWHYKDDETHVRFFSKRSFQWLEKRHDLRLEFHSDSVILFQTLETARSE
jgi:transcription initiation factor TFIIIB Brf1 subunit/transcription initiation factor TFIIB